MDYETIPERARREAGAEFVAALARDLAHEWCEIYKAMSNRTTNMVRFQCGPFEYLYDDDASLEATGRVHYDPVMEARLVAVQRIFAVSGKSPGRLPLERLGGWFLKHIMRAGRAFLSRGGTRLQKPSLQMQKHIDLATC